MKNKEPCEYEVISQVYCGKRSNIYMARRASDNLLVAIKTTNKEYPSNEDIKYLKKEFKLGNSIHSDDVVKYLEIKNYDAGIVLIEEYFNGDSLDNILKSHVFTVEEFLMAAIHLCEGLEKIHKAHIVHADIKPSNILYNGENRQIKILDFGSAIYTSQEKLPDKYSITTDNVEYISPEQTGRMKRMIDYRSDLYSLGIVFYQMLTGEVPYKSKDRSKIVYYHIAKPPRPVNVVKPEIPKIISDIIIKLIAKNPDERYQLAIDLKMDLQRCLTNLGDIYSLSFKLGECSSNLIIPNKLYGRSNEYKMILYSFERVVSGGTEIVLISGSPGIGKSALIEEVRKPVLLKQGHFILGKFEQYQNEIPYQAIAQALEKLVNQLLLDTPEQLQIWRKKILEAVGNNGQIVTEVIPSLKLIIGEQPLVPKLGVIETKNRFNLVFENFMQAIACKDSPLVMFIDDWQWADSASLNFIKMLMANRPNQYLLVLGAYRDNQPDLIRPVIALIDELIQNNVKTTTLQLKDLQREDIQVLLEESIIGSKKDLKAIENLAAFIYAKTQGNPFFVKQFLRSLYEMNYIWFDYSLLEWQWDTREILKQNITENVVELLIHKISTMEPTTIQELKYGACIGTHFNLQTIALINNKSVEAIQRDLQVAVNEGLIDFEQKVGAYKFTHDRVQQAVYSMITDKMTKKIHLQLGRLFWRKYSEENSLHLFEIVRQLNAGRMIITDENEKLQLAELNLQAGIIAKSSSAYNSAFIYFKTGIELLSSNTWQENYKLTLQLYSEITEAAYLIGDYEKMKEFAEVVLENAITLADKITVYKVKIDASQAQLNLKEALNIGLSVLKLMQIDIPLEPNPSDIMQSFAKVEKAMEGIEVENLIDQFPMQDLEKLAAMEIMLSTLPATYKAAPMLTPIIACSMVEFSIEYGNSHLSPGAYAFYGLLLCSVKNDIDLGYKFARMSINLTEKQNLKQCKAMILEIDNYCIKHWKEHLKETLTSLLEGYRSGMENGDFQYGGYCLPAYAKNSFYLGQSLESLEKEILEYSNVLQKLEQGLSLNYLNIFGQLVLNMQGKTQNPRILIGEFCNEDKLITMAKDIGDLVGAFFLFLSKMMLNYYFGEYSSAVEYAQMAEKNLSGVAAMVDIPVYYYFDSLARLARYTAMSEDEQKTTRERVENSQAQMKTWSDFAPMNFLHKYHLVEAELYRVMGNIVAAKENYKVAIDLAKENEYLNDEALAYELEGKFYLEEGQKDTARTYLLQAHYKYQVWGAMAKVKDMEISYPDVFKENRVLHETATSIDLLSIVKASQAISSEINLDALLSRLMTVMLENMGAQRGFFVQKREGELVLEAYVDEETNQKEVLTSIPLYKYQNIPKKVIQYTERTDESVVYPDSVYKDLFALDSYIAEKKPKSFFSTTVKLKNEVKGVLYLENNLVEGVFSPERVEVIELLATQTAISLENALLYQTLMQKEASLIASEEKFSKAFRYSADVMGIIRISDKRYNEINETFIEVLGYSREEVIGYTSIDFKLWHTEEDRTRVYNMVVEGKDIRNMETLWKTKSGEIKVGLLSTDVLEVGDECCVLFVWHDYTERKLAEEALQRAHDELEQQVQKRTEELQKINEELLQLSAVDGLTGIANRRYFDEFLEREWQRAIRDGKEIALLMVDIDFFKYYNGTYGHLAGDECIKQIAGLLKNSVKRATDLVARYGGEEFVVVLTGTAPQKAVAVGEMLRCRVEKLKIKHEKSSINKYVTVSIGVAVKVPLRNETRNNIIEAADKALYQAKQEGRNRIMLAKIE